MSRRGKIVELILIVIAIFSVFFAFGCTKAVDSELLSQDEFLKDMASGIYESSALKNMYSFYMVPEKNAEAFAVFAGSEIEKISKYADCHFEDEHFDKLAHMYIFAIEAQLYAASNSENSNIFYNIWNGASKIRNSVILEMREKYNLLVDPEQAASCIITEIETDQIEENNQTNVAEEGIEVDKNGVIINK